MATLLLVEDQTMVRSGLRALLEGSSQHRVIGEAATADEAVSLAKKLRPDVTVMDVGLGEKTGIAACREITEHDPCARVLMLSVFKEPEYVRAALRAGARGYVLKWTAAPALLQAITAVARGETALDSSLTAALKRPSPSPRLSPRERQVLALIASGLSTKEVAARLDLSVKTVETHRQHIMDKLDLHDVTSLVRYAMLEGITPP